MAAGSLIVTFELSPRSRAIIVEELGDAGEAVYLRDLGLGERAATLRRAAAVLAYDTSVELRPEELPLLAGARLLQFTTAGIDWIPLNVLPPELPVATAAPRPSRWPSTPWRWRSPRRNGSLPNMLR
jgi:hypothetical protein